MSETGKTITVALDAMGGDNAPAAIIDGAFLALEKEPRLKILLIGQQGAILSAIGDRPVDKERLEVINASEVIEMAEHPVNAIRKKKDSSIVVGLNLVKENKADIFVSAGSTGAVLVGGQLIVGRINGIDRTPIGAVYPTVRGASLLIDTGANMDPRIKNIQQYAVMGTIYMKNVMGIENPTVGLLNIGAEEEKGNAFYVQAHQALKTLDGVNFIGNVEARDFPLGLADIIVCDGFTGNIILKNYEGTAKALKDMIMTSIKSTLKSSIGGLLIKSALKKTLKKMDASEYGGAPLLGLKGLAVKTHGSAKAKEIYNTLMQCPTFVDNDIVGKISESIAELNVSAENTDSNK